jgi:hypothetical protein
MGVHADTEAYAKVKEALEIPLDEPIFILRGQDALAFPAIARYHILAKQVEQNPPNEEWFANIVKSMDEFVAWAQDHPVKIPD